MFGLEHVVFPAKGARVMLCTNLWSSVGLYNGLQEQLLILYQILICPITVTSQTEIGLHKRQQLPLRLAWALTIHMSQERTLPKAWIHIQKSERTAGVSYVAIGPVKSLACCVIESMAYERLTSFNLQYTVGLRGEIG